MGLIERLKIWRLRPGILFAAKLAEHQAWGHPNASTLGPEANLMKLSHGLHMRLLDAEEGKPDGLYLSAMTPTPPGWTPLSADKGNGDEQ